MVKDLLIICLKGSIFLIHVKNLQVKNGFHNEAILYYHYQYKITLDIVTLYKDVVFYLPISSDFRGRIMLFLQCFIIKEVI